MARARNWTEEEFKLLLKNEELSADKVAEMAGRTEGAVEVVREGVKLWRNGKETHGILSKMMIRVLESDK